MNCRGCISGFLSAKDQLSVSVFLPALLLICSSFNIVAQSSERNLYEETLRTYLEESEKAYSNIIPERDFRNVIVIKNDHRSEKLPSRLGSYNVTYLDEIELVSLLAENDKKTAKKPSEVIVAEIRPMKNLGNKLIVSVGEYVARLEKKRLILALSGGIRVTFDFDCSTKEFLRSGFKLFGV